MLQHTTHRCRSERIVRPRIFGSGIMRLHSSTSFSWNSVVTRTSILNNVGTKGALKWFRKVWLINCKNCFTLLCFVRNLTLKKKKEKKKRNKETFESNAYFALITQSAREDISWCTFITCILGKRNKTDKKSATNYAISVENLIRFPMHFVLDIY